LAATRNAREQSPVTKLYYGSVELHPATTVLCLLREKIDEELKKKRVEEVNP